MFCFTFVRLQIFKLKSRHLFRKVFGINSRNKLVIVPMPVADAARVIGIIELFQREIGRVQCFSFSRKGQNIPLMFSFARRGRGSFDQAFIFEIFDDCEDSTSSLTTRAIYFKDTPNIKFSMDICIVAMGDKEAWCRLIHEKTGYVSNDRYFWNEAPNSSKIREKADDIKDSGYWQSVRDEYLNLKNQYLKRNDRRPSFVCYIESINNIYNMLRQKRIL